MVIAHSVLEFFCGPLHVQLECESARLRERLSSTLGMYDVRWDPPHRSIELAVHETGERTPMVDSSYLRCSRMAVCSGPNGLIATSSSGGGLTLVRSASLDCWHMNVPASLADLEELEDFLVLVLTTGWRSLDWIPLHAGALSHAGRCIIVCAPSGGGKSTLTAALMRAGWRTLGDDKLLLRIVDGRPRLAAVLHSLNLHPRTSQWFPEVGDLWLLPAYSAWTEKRKVSIAQIWPGSTERDGVPTHVVRLQRKLDQTTSSAQSLDPDEIFHTLVQQIVVPTERSEAARSLRAVAQLAGQVRGVEFAIGENAFHDDECLAALDRCLQ